MARRLDAWEPTPDEVQRILAEMKPIIQDFARRYARECERTTASRH
jgi:hypothetical protein